MSDVADYIEELRQRPAARAPATFGEIWNSEWTRSGLDTFGGVGRPLMDAQEELTNAVEAAHGKPLGELARERDLSLVGFDTRINTLGALVDALPEEQRKQLEPLKDVRKRAADKARTIERDAGDVNASTYGLSGTALAFLAGVSRQAVDPAALVANIATAPFGGPFKGPLLKFLGREALAGAAGQALVEPHIQAVRQDLGLEAGPQAGAINVLQAAIGSAGLAGVLRAGAAGFRVARRTLAGSEIAVRPGEAPAAPETRISEPLSALHEMLPPLAAVAPEDLDAAAHLAERNQLVFDMPASSPTPRGHELHGAKVEEAAAAIEAGRPQRQAPDLGDGRDLLTGNAGPVPFAPNFNPRLVQSFDGQTEQLIRPGGDRVTVHPMVVELDDIVASHNLEGRANPNYPAELQPRDRGAAASRTWVAEKAAGLEPELLGKSPTAGLGAPIIGPDGVIESGNGRALLLAAAYERHPERAAAYKRFLEDQGFDLAGFDKPVLVRMREGDIPMAERAKLAIEANVSATAGLSARERAFADAKQLDENLFSAYVPGDVQSAANSNFIRAFADRAVAAEERPQFIGADNRLSAEGARRVEAALVARAWQAPDIVSALYESADPTSKAILGAFADTAPQVARLRAAIEEGRVGADADPAPALLDAFRLVERARAGGPKLADLVNQVDLERGAVPDQVREAVRLYFRDDTLRLAASRDAVTARIEKAVTRSLEQQNTVGDLFGAKFDAVGTLRAAQLAGQALDEQALAGVGRADLVRLLDAKAPIDQIAEHPVVKTALEEDRRQPRTENMPGFGTDAYKAKRVFTFGGERVVGYDAIIPRLVEKAKAYAGALVDNGRRAVIVLGPPASGKSTLSERLAREYRAAIADPDDAKPTMAEFAGGIGSSAVHEESSILAAAALERLVVEGTNLVLPRVGADAAKMRATVELLKKLGYTVSMVNLQVEPDEAFRRSIRRFLSSGRIVRSDYFGSVGSKPRETYYILKKEGLFHDTAEIDANGKPGSEKIIDGSGELARRSLGKPDAEGARAGGGEAQRQPAQAQEIAKPIGDQALAQDADRALEDAGGDLEIQIPDPATGELRKVSARQALLEAEDQAHAADELVNCIGEEPEAAA